MTQTGLSPPVDERQEVSSFKRRMVAAFLLCLLPLVTVISEETFVAQYPSLKIDSIVAKNRTRESQEGKLSSSNQQHSQSLSSSPFLRGIGRNAQQVSRNNTVTESSHPSGLPNDEKGRRRITMVVKLSGELGNNLLYLFHGYAMKMQIEELLPNVTIDLVGEHQGADKWKRPAADIKKCFPNLRDFDFSSGRWSGEDSEFETRQKSQSAWLRQMGYNDRVVDVDNNFHNSMKFVQKMLKQQQEEPNNLVIQEPSNSKISLPYLRVHKMSINVLKYRTQVQQWLAFDKEACCGVLPDPDELVFHFRNFAAEGAPGYLVNKKGMVEVGPNHIVPLLSENMPPNASKVTLITRHYVDKPNAADAHINAIVKSGKFHLRVVPEQSGVEDFCLLLHAKHVVGTRLSTFASTAGVLGNQTSVTTYTVNSTETRTHKPSMFKPHGWNGDVDPTLNNRFRHVNVPGEYKE